MGTLWETTGGELGVVLVNTPLETVLVRTKTWLATRFGRLPAAIDPAWTLPGRIIPLTQNICLRGVLPAVWLRQLFGPAFFCSHLQRVKPPRGDNIWG